jgi:hypothetical protein
VNEKFLAIEYPDPDYNITFRSDCINYDVSIYAYDFGFDQHVVTLSPGEKYAMKSYLGQPFWAVSPSKIFLGNFTVHWDPEKKPAGISLVFYLLVFTLIILVGSGQSRHFVIKCPDDYLYLCDTCEPYDVNVPLTSSVMQKYGLELRKPIPYSEIDELGYKRHMHEITRVR